MTTRKLRSATLLILACLSMLAVACGTAPSAPFDMKVTLDKYFSNLPDDWGLISPSALSDQLKTARPFLVEIRETKEVAEGGHISGSINIPVRTLMKNLDKLPAKDQPIVVTCGSGHRSAMGMAALQLLGYTNVKSLAGGFSAWKAANLPFETGTPPAAKAGPTPSVDKDLLAALDTYFSNLPDGWNTISPAALNELLKTSQPFQIELRETSDVRSNGYIAGAKNIPVRTLFKNLDKLPPDKGAPIISECGTGHRSSMAMMGLGLLGYTNVRSLAGGFGAWTKAGLPVSK